MLGVTAFVVGAALIADWQAIGYDPCTQFSLFHHPELANKSKPGPICLDNFGLEVGVNTSSSYIPGTLHMIARTSGINLQGFIG